MRNTAILTITVATGDDEAGVASNGISRETAPALLRVLNQIQQQILDLLLTPESPEPNTNETTRLTPSA